MSIITYRAHSKVNEQAATTMLTATAATASKKTVATCTEATSKAAAISDSGNNGKVLIAYNLFRFR